jgi:uncharacterized protein (DUF983 family)
MSFPRKLWAVIRQRCPVCCEGKVFASSTRMNLVCPLCGIRFEREQGYFLGAMYLSYGMASCILGGFLFILHLLWPEVDLGWLVLVALVLFLPLVPAVFRYSRICWIAFDRWAWPGK